MLDTDSWTKHVNVLPVKKLTMRADKCARLELANDSNRKLTFKLKTTRPHDVKPKLGVGVVEPGGSIAMPVVYTPRLNERPFRQDDRLTVLIQELPSNVDTALEFWKGPGAQIQPLRYQIQLAPPPSTPKSRLLDKKSSATSTESGTTYTTTSTESGTTTGTETETETESEESEESETETSED